MGTAGRAERTISQQVGYGRDPAGNGYKGHPDRATPLISLSAKSESIKILWSWDCSCGCHLERRRQQGGREGKGGLAGGSIKRGKIVGF